MTCPLGSGPGEVGGASGALAASPKCTGDAGGSVQLSGKREMGATRTPRSGRRSLWTQSPRPEGWGLCHHLASGAKRLDPSFLAWGPGGPSTSRARVTGSQVFHRVGSRGGEAASRLQPSWSL